MASRSAERGEAAMAAIQHGDIKGSLSTVQLDVTDQKSIAAAVKLVDDQFGRLDVLVNNAGVYSKSADLKTQLEDNFSTNVTGAALVSEAFKALLFKSERPYLLHIGSTLGSLACSADRNRFDYDIPALAYRMSKAALNMLALQDSKEMGKHGVKVFSVCPGLVKSNLRGRAEAEISAGGKAIDPETSGKTILRIIEGGRDADVGKFVDMDGVVPW